MKSLKDLIGIRDYSIPDQAALDGAAPLTERGEVVNFFASELIEAARFYKNPVVLIGALAGGLFMLSRADSVSAMSNSGFNGGHHVGPDDSGDGGNHTSIGSTQIIRTDGMQAWADSHIAVNPADTIIDVGSEMVAVNTSGVKVLYGGGMGIVRVDGVNEIIGGGLSLGENNTFLKDGFVTFLTDPDAVISTPIENGTQYSIGVSGSDWDKVEKLVMPVGPRISKIARNQLEKLQGFGGTGTIFIDITNNGESASRVVVHGIDKDGKKTIVVEKNLFELGIDDRSSGKEAMMIPQKVGRSTILVALPALQDAKKIWHDESGIWHAQVGDEVLIMNKDKWEAVMPPIESVAVAQPTIELLKRVNIPFNVEGSPVELKMKGDDVVCIEVETQKQVCKNGKFNTDFLKRMTDLYGKPIDTGYGEKRGNYNPGTPSDEVRKVYGIDLYTRAVEANNINKWGYDTSKWSGGAFSMLMINRESNSWGMVFMEYPEDPEAPKYWIYENENNKVIIIPLN